MRRILRYGPELPATRPFTFGDLLVLLAVASLLYLGVRLAFSTPSVLVGPTISLDFSALPWYALLSSLRMAAAYCLSLLFSLVYGYVAAHNQTAEKTLMPLLDVLQSVPILSFLPVVLLGLSAVLTQDLAAELAAVVLIFTSQAWNLTYSFYQSIRTIPIELREAAGVFRLNPWLRFKKLELPFATIGLLWNSIMSWAGGWFFLMAAESYRVGDRDFRLPGLGSYLQTAADLGDLKAVGAGILALILVIVLIDQFLWRPLLAWAEKFKLEQVSGDRVPTSWVLDTLSRSRLVEYLDRQIRPEFSERVDKTIEAALQRGLRPPGHAITPGRSPWFGRAIQGVFAIVVLVGAWHAGSLLLTVPAARWADIAIGLLATFLRVSAAIVLALAWTIPVGVAIGTNPRLASVLQPVVQILASIPATALFPVVLLVLLSAPGGLNLAAILLMLMGSQWYLLFNVIAGASAIPLDLQYTADLLGLATFDRWRYLILPALFPYLVTGGITASGGAWNASIVAEYVTFGGRLHTTNGAGALIAHATSSGDYPLLLAATLALVAAVVTLNRTLWRWLYRKAEERFRLE